MDILTEDELIKKLDKRKTKLRDKSEFWKKLGRNNNSFEYMMNQHNLLIDMPSKKQRDRFIDKYTIANPDYDFFFNQDRIPIDFDEDKHSRTGIPLLVVDIDKFTTIKSMYKKILKAFFHIDKSLKLSTTEEFEHRVLNLINTLSVDMIILNYNGEKLLTNNNLSSVLYALCRLGKLAKISINTIGSISPNVFYSESVLLPIGNFYCIDGENNSKDISITRVKMSLDKESGQMVETSREKVVI